MNRRHLLALLGTSMSTGCLRMSAAENGTTADSMGITQSGTATTGAETETSEQTSTDHEDPPEYPLGLSDDGVDRLLFSEHSRTLAGPLFGPHGLESIGHDLKLPMNGPIEWRIIRP